MPASKPLGYRVLNAARGVAGAYTMRLLADLGASCSWLLWDEERPGDWPESAAFRGYFAHGIDVVSTPTPMSGVLDRLAQCAPAFDLVITDLNVTEAGPGRVLNAVHPSNQSLVVANADHFGRSGPYAAWQGDELTDYALGGYWAIAGDPEREPLRVPGYQAQFHAGQQLAIAALAALRHARLTGEGQEVEVSAVEAMLGAHWSTTIAWTHEGRVFKRTGPDLYQANDGWVFFYTFGLYQNLFILIERPDLLDDPRWNTIAAWRANGEALWGMVRDWCLTQPVETIVEAAQDLRIPVTPMATAADLLADRQLASRSYFQTVDGIRYPGMPYRWGERWEPAPAEPRLQAALDAPDPAVVAPARPVTSPAVPPRSGPLAGLCVLELTNNWAGPIAGRHLGDLGAEVIKIELATKPATRASHYPGKEPGKYHWNRSGYFNEMNRNKRGLALDLAKPRGKELFLDLVRRADVVVENNSARVMPNLDVGYDALSEVNPRLVMASISGFGASGYRRDWVAFGSNIEAASGLAAITGYPGDVPYRTGSFVADPIAGSHAVIGILAALERRERTGRGDHLDIALTESALPFMLESLVYVQEHGELMPRTGNADPRHAPTGAYPCAGMDDWLAIAVRTDQQWQRLCAVAGIDAATYACAADRVAAREGIDARVSAWTRTQSQYEAARQLQARGVPAAPILHNWQLHSDPHLYARDAFIPIEHPDTGVLPYPGFPWRFSLTPPGVTCAAPRFGEGNDFVFRSVLGLSPDDVADLYASGVTATTPTMPTPVVV